MYTFYILYIYLTSLFICLLMGTSLLPYHDHSNNAAMNTRLHISI